MADPNIYFKFKDNSYWFELNANTFVNLLRHQPQQSDAYRIDVSNPNDQWFLT
jgi:hypothetical protein